MTNNTNTRFNIVGINGGTTSGRIIYGAGTGAVVDSDNLQYVAASTQLLVKGIITSTLAVSNTTFPVLLTVNLPAHTAMTTATAFPQVVSSTGTQTWVDGTVADQSNWWIKAPTWNGTTTLATFTIGSNLKVDAPIAGAKGAITENNAIWANGNLKVSGQIKFAGTNSTGAGSALLGANSPASTLTAPYTWITVITSDGSTAYIPVWK